MLKLNYLGKSVLSTQAKYRKAPPIEVCGGGTQSAPMTGWATSI